jgi:hydroxymethylpyrimidine/phosphomethylpyrimidine kinase
MKTVLTIAGFDPSSGAGITADLMVFAAHGLVGTACITALTVQSTQGVRSTYPVSAEIVGETIEFLDADLRPAGIKIGMVGNQANISRICDYMKIVNVGHSNTGSSSYVPIVLDPVLRSSSGRELLDPSGLAAMGDRLLPLADWITPNLDELATLLNQPTVDRDDVPDACRALQAGVAATGDGEGRLGIIATGGHLDRPDDFLLMPNGEGLWLAGERVSTRSTHGTGCAFSSAFLSRLVLGDKAEDAARAAKAYVVGALQAATAIGRGNGPINHLWQLGKL